MSDPKENKQNKTQEDQPGNEMYTEWQRVLGNPDNLIVSDSLRAALPDEFSTDERLDFGDLDNIDSSFASVQFRLTGISLALLAAHWN